MNYSAAQIPDKAKTAVVSTKAKGEGSKTPRGEGSKTPILRGK
jgi:hypothetical protein